MSLAWSGSTEGRTHAYAGSKERLVQGQEQSREGDELPPWELCHHVLALSLCETTQGVMYFTGTDPAAFFISCNIQYSHPFETIHLFIKIKSNKRCINPQYSVTKMNYHLEPVFQIVVLLYPHNSMRALGLLAQFKRLEDYAEFTLFSYICKNQQGESKRIF